VAEAAWEGWIAPGTLWEQVCNTAPYLTAKLRRAGARRLIALDSFQAVLPDWESILNADLTTEEQLEDYFAVCLSCHYATVAAFVPTDVDTKIRGLIWRKTRDRESLRRMCDFALRAAGWSVDGVSARTIHAGELGAVSGHNGEWLSVMCGAHGRFLAVGDEEYAEKSGAAIEAELWREARAFEWLLKTPGREIDALKAASALTHNAGDVDQGISFWERRRAESLARFGRLAHENAGAYGGWFQVAARLYKDGLSAEGHRHYPLRGVKGLRQSGDLLLPVSPFLDDWGSLVARHPALSNEDRAEIVDALAKGCRKIPGQAGYYRALAGFAETVPHVFAQVQQLVPNSARKELRDPELRRLIAIPRASFESAWRKKVEAQRRSNR